MFPAKSGNGLAAQTVALPPGHRQTVGTKDNVAVAGVGKLQHNTGACYQLAAELPLVLG